MCDVGRPFAEGDHAADARYRYKSEQWGESKRALEVKLRDLRTLLELSRSQARRGDPSHPEFYGCDVVFWFALR